MIYDCLYYQFIDNINNNMDSFTFDNIFSYCDFDTKLIIQRVCKQFMHIQFELYNVAEYGVVAHQKKYNVMSLPHDMTNIVRDETSNILLLNGITNKSYRLVNYAIKCGASNFVDALRYSYHFDRVDMIVHLLERGGDFMYIFDIIIPDKKMTFIKPIIDCAIRMKKCSFEITSTYIFVTIHNETEQGIMLKTNIGKELKDLYGNNATDMHFNV